jgi:hypothetical protein
MNQSVVVNTKEGGITVPSVVLLLLTGSVTVFVPAG